MLKQQFRMMLASSSPRRNELLSYLGVPFDVIKPDFNEDINAETPIRAMELVLEEKLKAAKDFQRRGEIPQGLSPFIIVSDTMVVKDNKVFGKPLNVEQARQMLVSLESSVHQVITGVGLAYIVDANWRFEKIYSITEVEFGVIDHYLLKHYLKSGDSLDKAGAYGIQGGGQVFIKKINGNYSSVVGLPLAMIVEKLEEIFSPEHWSTFFI